MTFEEMQALMREMLEVQRKLQEDSLRQLERAQNQSEQIRAQGEQIRAQGEQIQAQGEQIRELGQHAQAVTDQIEMLAELGTRYERRLNQLVGYSISAESDRLDLAERMLDLEMRVRKLEADDGPAA